MIGIQCTPQYSHPRVYPLAINQTLNHHHTPLKLKSSFTGSEDSPDGRCKPSSSAPCTISGSESSAGSSGSDNNLEPSLAIGQDHHHHHHHQQQQRVNNRQPSGTTTTTTGPLIMNNGGLAPIDTSLVDLEKEQRLGYLHNYESAYMPKFQDAGGDQQLIDKEAYIDYGQRAAPGDGFLELDYDRLNAAGLLVDDRDDYYEHEPPPPPQPREHYMLPTEQQQQQQQSSMFNPQFLPNFNDMMRLVARYESSAAEQQSKFYPNESDEYQEIVAESLPYRQQPPPPPPPPLSVGCFANRSSLELNRCEREDFASLQKTQTTGRRKPKYSARQADVSGVGGNSFLS